LTKGMNFFGGLADVDDNPFGERAAWISRTWRLGYLKSRLSIMARAFGIEQVAFVGRSAAG